MVYCHPESVPKSLAKSWTWTCSCHSLHGLTLPPSSSKTPLRNSSSASHTWAWQLFSDKLWSCVSQRCPWLSHSFFLISIFMQLFVTLLGEISTEIPSSRTTLSHKVCKTKCDLISCNYICQYMLQPFTFSLIPLLNNTLPALINVIQNIWCIKDLPVAASDCLKHPGSF